MGVVVSAVRHDAILCPGESAREAGRLIWCMLGMGVGRRDKMGWLRLRG